MKPSKSISFEPIDFNKTGFSRGSSINGAILVRSERFYGFLMQGSGDSAKDIS
jgi:hypothetical protein